MQDILILNYYSSINSVMPASSLMPGESDLIQLIKSFKREVNHEQLKSRIDNSKSVIVTW